MTRKISGSKCAWITNQLTNTEMSARELADDLGVTHWTIRRHAKNQCGHTSRELGFCHEQDAWVPISMVLNPHDSRVVCGSCGAELDDGGVCGWCERVNEVLGGD